MTRLKRSGWSFALGEKIGVVGGGDWGFFFGTLSLDRVEGWLRKSGRAGLGVLEFIWDVNVRNI